jgi:hypothetical protein
MVTFVILSAIAVLMFSLIAAFLLYHARKQGKEFKARVDQSNAGGRP